MSSAICGTSLDIANNIHFQKSSSHHFEESNLSASCLDISHMLLTNDSLIVFHHNKLSILSVIDNQFISSSISLYTSKNDSYEPIFFISIKFV
jgi:hypothetical protein